MQEETSLKLEYTTRKSYPAQIHRLPEGILNAAPETIGSPDFRLMTAFEQRARGLDSLGMDTTALHCNDAV